MAGIGAAVILGGAMVALAGPALLALGLIEAVSMAVIVPAAVGAGTVTGVVTRIFMDDTLVDEKYHEVLQFVVQVFSKVWEADETKQGSKEFKTISDYRLDGRTYSLEKALLLLYDPDKGKANFDGTILSECTAASQDKLLKRIESIRVIHTIRNLLASQCYIGVVGIQDAGEFFSDIVLSDSRIGQ